MNPKLCEAYDEEGAPCPWPATRKLTVQEGGGSMFAEHYCEAHAAAMRDCDDPGFAILNDEAIGERAAEIEAEAPPAEIDRAEELREWHLARRAEERATLARDAEYWRDERGMKYLVRFFSREDGLEHWKFDAAMKPDLALWVCEVIDLASGEQTPFPAEWAMEREIAKCAGDAIFDPELGRCVPANAPEAAAA